MTVQKHRLELTRQFNDPLKEVVGGGDKRETKGYYNRLAVLVVLQEIYFRRSQSNSRLTFGGQTEGQTCHTDTLALAAVLYIQTDTLFSIFSPISSISFYILRNTFEFCI